MKLTPKPDRRRVPANQRRDVTLPATRVTPAQLAALRAEADRRGTGVSEEIRRRLFQAPHL